MPEPRTANGEGASEDVTRLRWYQFTLTDLLAFVTAVPLWVGVVAAVEFAASELSYEWFGIGWYSDVRHFLCYRVGLSVEFVCGYVAFAMIQLPAWVCYAVIAAALGLLRRKWAFPIGVAFLTSVFVWDLMSNYFMGIHGYIRLRLVSLFGVAVAASCFAVTRRIRGRSHSPARKAGPIAVWLTCLAVVALVGVSVYGWWLVDLKRKEGLELQQGIHEAQEMFRSANSQ